MKTVIVGGVAGGMSAATRLRRLDEAAEIVVFERGGYVSFANCGLPYFVGGVIEDRSALLLQTPKGLAARFGLDVRINHEVVAIDRVKQSVRVRNLVSGVLFDETYDTLVLAAGAASGSFTDTSGVPHFSLRTIDDIDHITATLDAADSPPAVVVIGGGYIGLEAVENLRRRDAQVTLVQRGAQVLSPLDPEMAAPVLRELIANDVDVRLHTTVMATAGRDVLLSDGSVVTADLVIDASGVHPQSALAAAAGLTLGDTGGIVVDDVQRTNDPRIYAVGDGVLKVDAIDGAETLVTMAGLANRHGRAAADAIAGTPHPAVDAFGTAIVGVFNLTVAMTGWSEKRLVASGRPHRVIHTHPASHATYYPGAEQMAVKLFVEPDTDRILGAQIVGGQGVDKRIDVIAVAMAGRITASGLKDLELAYAPQYGSAKDPINQLGYVADNLASGLDRTVQWHELDHARADGAVLVDVRTPAEFNTGHIPDALNIPLDDLRNRLPELTGNRVIVHCQVGQRGHTAARILAQHGITVSNLDGGYQTWRNGTAHIHPISTHEGAPA